MKSYFRNGYVLMKGSTEELDAIGARVRSDECADVEQLVNDRKRLWIEVMFLLELVTGEYGENFRQSHYWEGDEKDGYTATRVDDPEP